MTWWLFWQDGYEALAALDDDGDGWLRGAELAGLVGWRDMNGDGRCGPGEVRPLADHGVAALRCASDGTEPATPGALASPRHSAGILHRDGSSAPSWDWVAP